MRETNTQRWILRTRLFGADEYECPACGGIVRRPAPACPACGTPLRPAKGDLGWLDEAEEMDWMAGD